jgi:hypothetical protein
MNKNGRGRTDIQISTVIRGSNCAGSRWRAEHKQTQIYTTSLDEGAKHIQMKKI